MSKPFHTKSLNCRFLTQPVHVVQIKKDNILKASWVLLAVLFNEGVTEPEEANEEDDQTLRLVLRDNDSCTLVLGTEQLQHIQNKGFSDLIEVAPTLWRVIDIHLAQTVAEVPGVVNHLAKLLAEDNISILHFSTFSSELFLVREVEFERAITCIKKKAENALNLVLQEHSLNITSQHSLPNRRWTDSDSHQSDGISASSPEMFELSDHKPGLFLDVFPDTQLLVRLQKEQLQQSAWEITHFFLFEVGQNENRLMTFIDLDGEVSLIMPQSYAERFPTHTLVVCPLEWRAIKLGGRAFAFDETGVVASLTLTDPRLPILNMSTFSTNITLVEGIQLENTVTHLSNELCAIPRYLDEK